MRVVIVLKNEKTETIENVYNVFGNKNKLEIFDRPKELSEFYKTNLPYVGAEEIEYALEINNVEALKHYSLSKAPLNYQLVYVKE